VIDGAAGARSLPGSTPAPARAAGQVPASGGVRGSAKNDWNFSGISALAASGECDVSGEPMSVWAAVVTLVVAAAAYLAGDPTTLLSGVAEIVAVLTLFTLVCMGEALN
jgi:hypothetical protein